jgi:hypothetical protein
VNSGTLEETARRVGHARWLEQRCFELLGGWVASTPEPEVKLVFARQSHHHAWHAELFDRVLPAANGFVPDGLVVAPDPGWAGFLVELSGLRTTLDRLAGVFELLLPAKVAAYEVWLATADPVRDAPLVRWLGFVLADERADLREGRALLEQFPGARSAPQRETLAAGLARAGALLN